MKANEHLQRTIPDHAFRSIGLPDAELRLVKSELHSAIKAAITKEGWSQKIAGEKLGWGQPDVSKIMNDRFSQHSIDRLLKAALDLGLVISFGIAAASSKKEAGRVALVERVKGAVGGKARAVSPARRPASKSSRRQPGAAAYATAE